MSFASLLHVPSSKKIPLLLECLLCNDKFPADAVSDGKYFVETGICRACYRKGQQAQPQIWCFGKLQTKRSPGFHEENDSCSKLCPDRNVCRKFISNILKEKTRNG